MAKTTGPIAEGRPALRASLDRLAQKLQESKSKRPGSILLRLSGSDGGTYSLECSEKEVRVAESAAAGVEGQSLIEVIGDARTIRAILDGTKDATKQFLVGGIRVRGDLRHFSDLAVELGILGTPL